MAIFYYWQRVACINVNLFRAYLVFLPNNHIIYSSSCWSYVIISIRNYICVTTKRPGGNSLYFVWYRRAAAIAPIFQVIYTSIGHDFISNIHLYPSIQSPAVLNLIIWPFSLSLHLIMLLSDKNQFRIQYLTVLLIFCLKLFHLNGNKEHFLLSSMMFYTWKGILSIFQYTFIGWVWGGPVAHLYQLHAWIPPPPDQTASMLFQLNWIFWNHISLSTIYVKNTKCNFEQKSLARDSFYLFNVFETSIEVYAVKWGNLPNNKYPYTGPFSRNVHNISVLQGSQQC